MHFIAEIILLLKTPCRGEVDSVTDDYCKLVKTFLIVSECKTDIYFIRCLVQALANNTVVLTVGDYLALLPLTAYRLRNYND